MQPLIGISCSRVIGGAWGVYSRGHFMHYIYEEYIRAIAECGGAPVIIPASDSKKALEEIIGRVDGLLLSGGPDIHPRHYGESMLPGLGEIDTGLDHAELFLAKQAMDRKLPLLAICRGIQVLNVAMGGTLYQDIASQEKGAINHTPSIDKAALSHTVEIETETRLYDILKRGSLWVNSKHHQAVKDVASELIVCAWSKDGIIEAVESPASPFAIGVQWHPEGTWQDNPGDRALFEAFVASAGTGNRHLRG